MPFNASAALVHALAEDRGHARRAELIGAALPTDWREAPREVRRLLRDVAPHAVIHFGVSSRAAHFRIESRAFNAAKAAADCAGRLPQGFYVRPGQPPMLPVTLPIARLLRSLHSAGLPASISGDAGRYLCNAVLYASLLEMTEAENRTLAGFVHIPALTQEQIEGTAETGGGLGWRAISKGASLLIRSLAEYLRSHRARAL